MYRWYVLLTIWLFKCILHCNILCVCIFMTCSTYYCFVTLKDVWNAYVYVYMYSHTFRLCNSYWVSTAAMVTRTHLTVTFMCTVFLLIKSVYEQYIFTHVTKCIRPPKNWSDSWKVNYRLSWCQPRKILLSLFSLLWILNCCLF